MTSRRASLLRTLLIWSLLELLAAYQIPADSGGRVLTEWLRALARPLVGGVELVARTSDDLLWGIRDLRRLAAENERLRSRLEEAEARGILLGEEVEALREALSLTSATLPPGRRAVVARCVSRSLGLGRMELRAGLADGVRRDNAAVSGSGLVGRVVRAGHHSSWLELITHPAAAVAVQVADGSIQGLAVGTGQGALRVEFVPRSARLLRGTTLFSSGADRVYPPGIPAVTVRSVRESDAAFLEVLASPMAELATLQVVLVLTDQVERGAAGAVP